MTVHELSDEIGARRVALEPVMNFQQRRAMPYQIGLNAANQTLPVGGVHIRPTIGQWRTPVGICPFEWVVLRVHNRL